jgi:hypothetical protein
LFSSCSIYINFFSEFESNVAYVQFPHWQRNNLNLIQQNKQNIINNVLLAEYEGLQIKIQCQITQAKMSTP